MPRSRCAGWPGILALLLALTLSGGEIFAILPVQLPDPTAFTWALLLLAITSALARWQAGGLADRAGPARLLAACAAIGVLVLAMTALGAAHTGVTRGVLVALGAAVFGIAYGAAQNLTLLLSFQLAGVGAAAAGSSLLAAMLGCAALAAVAALTAIGGTTRTPPPGH